MKAQSWSEAAIKIKISGGGRKQDQQQQEQLQQTERALKEADQAHAEAAKAVSVQQAALASIKEQLKKLDVQKADLNKQREVQQKVLAAQLKAAYQIGGHDYTQLLLNQQSRCLLMPPRIHRHHCQPRRLYPLT